VWQYDVAYSNYNYNPNIWTRIKWKEKLRNQWLLSKNPNKLDNDPDKDQETNIKNKEINKLKSKRLIYRKEDNYWKGWEKDNKNKMSMDNKC
jgi:hypothetical protein